MIMYSNTDPITTDPQTLHLSPTQMRLVFSFLLCLCFFNRADSSCSSSQTCAALGSYYIWEGSSLSFIAAMMATTDVTIAAYNKATVTNKDSVQSGTRVNVPFDCACVNGSFLAHVFNYSVVSGDTYDAVAETKYANLTTTEAMAWFNDFPANNIPNVNTALSVVVNCSCGNSKVGNYGMFVTYPLRDVDDLASVAKAAGVAESLVEGYNPGVNFSRGSGYVYVPGKDENGNFVFLKPRSAGLGGGAIAGIVVGVIAGVLLVAGCVYFGVYRKKKKVDTTVLLTTSEDQSSQSLRATGIPDKPTESNSGSRAPTGITVDKSVEFTFEELSRATDNFSLANKIGQGGFGAVYYAELRGEKAAIKKMDMQASKEFLAELNVLTRVHHLNLVRLIGYCVEGSLFLVYEYIENGNLSQHLRGSERDPIPWSNRVQIALDSARGLEYIHEHTVPVYIHRDIKSANILIDKNYHAKVADFGLTKLTEVGSTSLPTRLVGTFGYMPPEYAQYGEVSPKVDVYAFGVVLYELISAKEAVVRANASGAESRGLVGLFEEVLSQPDPREDLQKVVDPRLGENYPLESVHKMAQLAKVCVHENKDLRPSMRSIVVALMTLSSSTEDWDVGSFYENQSLVNLMSGR